MAAILSYLGMAIGALGLFAGYYVLDAQPDKALRLVTLSAVGVVGVLAFLRHVVFHQDDAKRMGWETERPDWAYEVGFANLAFGGVALVSSLGTLPSKALAVSLLSYGLYLAQAGLLHGYRYFTDPVKSPARLWRSCATTLLYAGNLIYFGLLAWWR